MGVSMIPLKTAHSVTYFWFSKTAPDGKDARGDDALGENGPNEVLHVRGESERHCFARHEGRY